MNAFIYIVMCRCPATLYGADDEQVHIDSVWTSERKAKKQWLELNSDDKEKWREDYGYSFFSVERYRIST